MPSQRRVRRMRDVLEKRQDDLALVLEDVHDPHNASAVLRSCDAFAVGRVALCYAAREEFPDISKGVAGHVPKWLDLERYDSVEACVAALRARGLRLYITAPGRKPRDYRTVDWTQPAAIVVGNEHRGCSEAIQALADGVVTIPMLGMAQSLNVSVAAAVILAEVARQRRQPDGAPPRSWTPAKEEALQRWIARDEPWAQPE